ncbi:MAG: thioesterase family protein [Bacteroidota bacterium]
MKNFKHKTPIQVRFSDMDMMGHANNAVYSSYIEHARLRYFEEVVAEGEWSKQEGLILARLEIDFRSPLFNKDEVFVYTRCARMGTKSFDMECVIVRVKNNTEEIIADTKTVIVCFDYHTGKTVPISEVRKKKIAAYEGVTV